MHRPGTYDFRHEPICSGKRAVDTIEGAVGESHDSVRSKKQKLGHSSEPAYIRCTETSTVPSFGARSSVLRVLMSFSRSVLGVYMYVRCGWNLRRLASVSTIKQLFCSHADHKRGGDILVLPRLGWDTDARTEARAWTGDGKREAAVAPS